MDPSIMKLLEEDEDETMHSGADVEAFTAALNRDIGGDIFDSDKVPLPQGSSYTSTQIAAWQTSNHDEKSRHQSLQELDNKQPKEGKQHDTDSPNQQQKNESVQSLTHSVSASESSSQAALNAAAKQGTQVPLAMLYSLIQPQLDKDKQMQFLTLYDKLKKNEISKDSFIRNMKSIVGDQVLKMAVYKFQSQATKGSQTVPGQFPPQYLASQTPIDDSSNLAVESSAQKLHELENQTDLRGTHGNLMPSSSLTAVKQERDCSPFPIQGLNRQQHQHLHSSQASFPMFPTLKEQRDDVQMRQISDQQNRNANQLGLMKQNPFGEAKRLPGGGSLNIPGASRIQQNSLQWQQSAANKEQKSTFSSPMTNLKTKPVEHFHHQQQQLQRSHSSSMSSQMDTSAMLSSGTPSSLGLENNGKTPVKKPCVGQKKPLDLLGSSPPPSGKKQKVSGPFLDQSIEQLNDVTAVSGVNLREEEEQLFSGTKDENRVSEASRRVVQEEEEKLVLQKIPLQKKLAEIMAKFGLKNMSSDVERCLSLCVEERIRELISSLIRLSKQRVDVEKLRHRTIVTSDVHEEILSINRKAREEWEKKQADFEKLHKENEPEGNIGFDGDKEKDEGRGKSIKLNKEEDDKLRTTAANVAARAAVGGDDVLSKWQLMADQARQKREGGDDVASGKDVTKKNSLIPTRSSRDFQEAEKRTHSSALVTSGALRRAGRNQGITQARIARSITVKDVISVLEREAQMSKSALIYRLYEKSRSDASAESS